MQLICRKIQYVIFRVLEISSFFHSAFVINRKHVWFFFFWILRLTARKAVLKKQPELEVVPSDDEMIFITTANPTEVMSLSFFKCNKVN